ncbi:hypothetical protein TH606_04275 [Thermodesulfatator autotrophicus]|uniref:Uncharacterized protein n=1 Tax=Thermodesulfatator autotrophicus TaxID=1795632 RepID=A0A177E845_9BACT|nr:hypothetical protein TH606_04275 [Thermodesulfatator autotrophicus]
MLAIYLIRDRCLDQLKMPFALWTREAVGQLIERKFSIKLSVWTVLEEVGIYTTEAIEEGL